MMRDYYYDLITDQRNAWHDQILKLFLKLTSFVYSAAVKLVFLAYKLNIFSSKKLPKPVICVGNIVLGGTGKTPFVVMLVQYFKSKGLRPAVLIRGYMSQAGVESDEAIMMKELLSGVPICIGADRYTSGLKALKNLEIDLFIMDDGFQHWRLHRDIDIVLVQSECPFANNQILPRGFLRECPSAISRADIVVCNAGDYIKTENIIRSVGYEGVLVQSDIKPNNLRNIKDGSLVELDVLKGKNMLAFCGLGSPQKFWKTLEDLNYNLIEKKTYSDHYNYQKDDVFNLLDLAKECGVEVLVTTHKDAVKLKKFKGLFQDLQWYFIDIENIITQGKNNFFKKINEKITV